MRRPADKPRYEPAAAGVDCVGDAEGRGVEARCLVGSGPSLPWGCGGVCKVEAGEPEVRVLLEGDVAERYILASGQVPEKSEVGEGCICFLDRLNWMLREASRYSLSAMPSTSRVARAGCAVDGERLLLPRGQFQTLLPIDIVMTSARSTSRPELVL